MPSPMRTIPPWMSGFVRPMRSHKGPHEGLQHRVHHPVQRDQDADTHRFGQREPRRGEDRDVQRDDDEEDTVAEGVPEPRHRQCQDHAIFHCYFSMRKGSRSLPVCFLPPIYRESNSVPPPVLRKFPANVFRVFPAPPGFQMPATFGRFLYPEKRWGGNGIETLAAASIRISIPPAPWVDIL